MCGTLLHRKSSPVELAFGFSFEINVKAFGLDLCRLCQLDHMEMCVLLRITTTRDEMWLNCLLVGSNIPGSLLCLLFSSCSF
jgi:hypothetical protein